MVHEKLVTSNPQISTDHDGDGDGDGDDDDDDDDDNEMTQHLYWDLAELGLGNPGGI